MLPYPLRSFEAFFQVAIFRDREITLYFENFPSSFVQKIAASKHLDTRGRKKMDKEAARIISFPIQEEYQEQTEEDFLNELIDEGISPLDLQRDLARLMNEVVALRVEKRWRDIVELCYPLEEKLPHLATAESAAMLQGEVVFALCQLHRYDDALNLARSLVAQAPDVFHTHSQAAFVAYMSLLADKNREILLTPELRKKRLELAHRSFARAEELRPDSVTVFYRHGMLFRTIQQKPDRALPLFKRAVANWESFDDEAKKKRHHERKNYVKALYQLALCYLETGQLAPAITTIERCINENTSTQYISSVNAYYTLGKILLEARFVEKAIQALERAAVDADPLRHDYVFELLARAFLADKKETRALETISRIPKNARRPYVLWTQADILVALRQIEQARQVLLRATERDRLGQHKAWIRLTRLELKASALDKALDYADRADKFFHKTYGKPYHEALFWKAVIFIKMKKRTDAEKVIEELYHFNPFYPHLRRLRQEAAKLPSLPEDGAAP